MGNAQGVYAPTTRLRQEWLVDPASGRTVDSVRAVPRKRGALAAALRLGQRRRSSSAQQLPVDVRTRRLSTTVLRSK